MGAEKNKLKNSPASEAFVYLNSPEQVAKYLNLPKSALQSVNFSSELQNLKSFFKDEKKIIDFITSFPPMVVSVSENDFKKVMRYPAAGLFMKRTNLIVIVRDSDHESYTLRHELTHYIADIGRKQNPQKPLVMFSWFNEGLTVFFAESSAPHSKAQIGDYSNGLLTAVLLDTIVGSKNLRNAYLTSDFSAVEKDLDRKFGSGFFKSLISFPNGYVATTFLVEKCGTHLPPELLAGVIATSPLLGRSVLPYRPWESMEKEFAWRHDVLIKDPVLSEMLFGVKSAKPTHEHYLFNKHSLDQIKKILSKNGYHLKKADVELTFAAAYYIRDNADQNLGIVYTSSWFFDKWKDVVEVFIKKDAPASLKKLFSPELKITPFGNTDRSS